MAGVTVSARQTEMEDRLPYLKFQPLK